MFVYPGRLFITSLSAHRITVNCLMSSLKRYTYLKVIQCITENRTHKSMLWNPNFYKVHAFVLLLWKTMLSRSTCGCLWTSQCFTCLLLGHSVYFTKEIANTAAFVATGKQTFRVIQKRQYSVRCKCCNIALSRICRDLIVSSFFDIIKPFATHFNNFTKYLVKILPSLNKQAYPSFGL